MRMSINRAAEAFTLTILYVGIVGGAVLLRAPELAMFATLSVIPLAVLFWKRRDMTLRQKLIRAGLLAYSIPIALLIIWGVVLYPGNMMYFFILSLSGACYFICFGFLIKDFWITRGR
jgi:hypothetical protein